jgi:hypothetical protein
VFSRKKLLKKAEFFCHIEFENPLTVRMDAKKRIAVVTHE